eukprot:scaffold7101_cov153-Amphora_coffeaeformis.AAC.15
MLRLVDFLIVCLVAGSTFAFQPPYQKCRNHYGFYCASNLRPSHPSSSSSDGSTPSVAKLNKATKIRSPLFPLHAATNGEDFHTRTPFSHRDIVWKIRPHPEQPWTSRVYFLFAARVLRAYLQITKRKLPAVVCPAGPLCQIEAWNKGKLVGRFGITTKPGPSFPVIVQQASKLFPKQRIPDVIQTGAIQYMVVEPDYRKRDIGSLALQVIAYVHAFQNCDFCMLVADDKGSGRLVEWYEQHGYQKAPMLQDFLGSPEGRFGVTMMGFTNATLPASCQIEWW